MISVNTKGRRPASPIRVKKAWKILKNALNVLRRPSKVLAKKVIFDNC